MPKHFTRRRLLVGAAPVAAAAPLAKLAWRQRRARARLRACTWAPPCRARPRGDDRRRGSRAREARTTSTRSLFPPPALPHQPGRVREYDLAALDRDDRGRAGRHFSAWTYNGTVPGPGHPRDRGRPPARQLRQRRRAPAHDPLPRDPPREHGRRLRDGRSRATPSRTSSPRARTGCSSTTATRRR